MLVPSSGLCIHICRCMYFFCIFCIFICICFVLIFVFVLYLYLSLSLSLSLSFPFYSQPHLKGEEMKTQVGKLQKSCVVAEKSVGRIDR